MEKVTPFLPADADLPVLGNNILNNSIKENLEIFHEVKLAISRETGKSKAMKFFFQDIDAEHIPDSVAKTYFEHFDTIKMFTTSAAEEEESSLSKPVPIYVDKDFIEAIRNNLEIDGLLLVPAAYPEAGTSPSGRKTYAKNEFTIILMPTKNKQPLRNMSYDYGDPCRRPNCIVDVFFE